MGDVTLVFLAALITALATGLGAVPLAFARNASRAWLGSANAVASGVMLAATVALAWEGGRESVGRTALGVALGIAFLLIADRLVHRQHDLVIGTLSGTDAVKAFLIVAVMTVHSAAEGIGVGSSFGAGQALGVFITTAIAVHNIPEGLAISLVLVPRGTRVATAAAWSVFSSLPQPLLAVPAFLFVDAFTSVLPVGLGFAGGAMAAMVAHQLLPEALEQAPRRRVGAIAVGSFVAMLAFQVYIL